MAQKQPTVLFADNAKANAGGWTAALITVVLGLVQLLSGQSVNTVSFSEALGVLASAAITGGITYYLTWRSRSQVKGVETSSGVVVTDPQMMTASLMDLKGKS